MEWKAIRFVWVVGPVARIKGITSPPPLSFALSAPLLPLKTFHKTKRALEVLEALEALAVQEVQPPPMKIFAAFSPDD